MSCSALNTKCGRDTNILLHVRVVIMTSPGINKLRVVSPNLSAFLWYVCIHVGLVLFLPFQSLFILTEAMPDGKQTGKPMRVFFQDQQESSEWKRLFVIAQKVHHAATIVADTLFSKLLYTQHYMCQSTLPWSFAHSVYLQVTYLVLLCPKIAAI